MEDGQKEFFNITRGQKKGINFEKVEESKQKLNFLTLYAFSSETGCAQKSEVGVLKTLLFKQLIIN
ncbi:MAG: hypothetical protein CM15mP127_07740 [Gammaproteobacteria bacterium]|nr:MAG: hypothetical protein CM15mP127_07740 [Gammaproteobacteria bacterium]